MKKKNFEKALAAFLSRKPFRPFCLELFHGVQFEISHPEALELKEELVVFTSTRQIKSVFEYAAVASLIDRTGG